LYNSEVAHKALEKEIFKYKVAIHSLGDAFRPLNPPVSVIMRTVKEMQKAKAR
jgi:hypothetical protein